ncbi:hypothetical protein [Qipengyuania sp.]
MDMTKEDRRRLAARNKRRNVTLVKVGVIALAAISASLAAYLVMGG